MCTQTEAEAEAEAQAEAQAEEVIYRALGFVCTTICGIDEN